ncbi:hypothetical protein Tco_0348781 [Tanacetum coccineum]
MRQKQAQQAARDEKLVPTEDRVKIGKSNLRMDPTLTQKEETYQVMLDIIKNTPCYNAFLTSADVLVIYMQQFWICPRVQNQQFAVPPSNDSLFDFLLDLGYKGQLKHISKMKIFSIKLTIDSQRQGLPYHTVDDDGVLDRLKFINKGEEYQVYGKPILSTLVINDIQNSKAYKTFVGISTGLIPPKKGRGKGA